MALCYYYCIISMLLILSSHSAEARPLLQHAEGAKEEVVVSSMIGSKPPGCEKRCIACGHCEAVQVPIVPQQGRRHFFSSAINSRSDDTSNYKPMNWKCKCGNRILNP